MLEVHRLWLLRFRLLAMDWEAEARPFNDVKVLARLDRMIACISCSLHSRAYVVTFLLSPGWRIILGKVARERLKTSLVANRSEIATRTLRTAKISWKWHASSLQHLSRYSDLGFVQSPFTPKVTPHHHMYSTRMYTCSALRRQLKGISRWVSSRYSLSIATSSASVTVNTAARVSIHSPYTLVCVAYLL